MALPIAPVLLLMLSPAPTHSGGRLPIWADVPQLLKDFAPAAESQVGIARRRIKVDQYRSLDGHTVTISGEYLDLHMPWGGSIRCVRGKLDLGFQTGRREMVADLMFHSPDFAFSETYEFQRGTFGTGSVVVNDDYGMEVNGRRGGDRLWLGFWEGKRYGLATMTRVPEGIRPDMVDRLADLELTETEHGIVIQPAAGRRGVEIYGASLIKEEPSVGIMSIMHAHEARALVPPWGGTRVDGGELFINEEDQYFLLVNDSCVTVIQPVGDDALDNPERMKRLEHLVISWA